MLFLSHLSTCRRSIPTVLRRVGFLAIALVVSGAGCTKALPAETLKATQRVELNIWGTVDDVDAYQPVFTAYRSAHPNVQINYRRLRLEEYEDALLNGFAEDRGPDIFLIHNDWIGKYASKITSMPAVTKVAYSTVTGSVKKEQTWELRSEPTIALRQYKDQYADIVLKDTIRKLPSSDGAPSQESIVAAPVWVDTLALYYNKDLLNAAGIPTPPADWSEFQDQAKKLTRLDSQGTVLQAGAAMGTAANVERGVDILSALMMQNGAEMSDANGVPTFDQVPESLSGQRSSPPAYQALEFYTDFANPAKETYTWNAQLPNSLDMFIQGRAAFFFGYSYHYDQIQARAPRLNLGVTKLPQIEGNPVRNVGNYWVWVVAKKAKNQDVSWNLLNFMMQSDQSKAILDRVKRPAARKALLSDQFNDERIGIFAEQVLTAKSWYRGNNPQLVEQTFEDLISAVLLGARIPESVNFAASKIRQTVTQ